jgi:hypothetical protein
MSQRNKFIFAAEIVAKEGSFSPHGAVSEEDRAQAAGPVATQPGWNLVAGGGNSGGRRGGFQAEAQAQGSPGEEEGGSGPRR